MNEILAAFEAESWARGDLDHLRHDAQRMLNAAMVASTRTINVVHASRGLGKTHGALITCCEFGLQRKNQRIVFAAPTREAAKQIVIAVMPHIIERAPESLRPVWQSSNHQYYFPSTGSAMIVEGADDEKGSHLRGPHADLAVVDEAAFMRHLHYVVKSVLFDMVHRVNGRIIIQSSSPDSVGHDFVGLAEEAIRNGAYSKFDIHSNPMLTEKQKQEKVEEMSGKTGAAAWLATNVRREYLVEFITELERAVIPEFDQSVHVVDEYTRPAFTDTYTFLDLGLIDLTHALFGYWDFERAVLVIEDEIAVQYERTADFAEKCKAKERELWGDLPYYQHVSSQSHNRAPYGRFSDNDPQILHDLAGYGLSFAPAIKVEKEAALNRLRLAFNQGKIEIHKRCVNLIHQLKVGIFKERRDSGYERLGGMAGHLDGIDALIYGWRMMNHTRNPLPPMLGMNAATHHMSPGLMERSRKSNSLNWPVRR